MTALRNAVSVSAKIVGPNERSATVTPEQRTARASNAARTRWANMTDEDRKKAGVKRARGLAARYGYQLVPIDTTNETED